MEVGREGGADMAKKIGERISLASTHRRVKQREQYIREEFPTTSVRVGRVLEVNPFAAPEALLECELELGLCTILLLTIVYGVWHTKERSRGGRVLPSSRAILLQRCGLWRWAGGVKGRLIHAQMTRSKRISYKGQVASRLPPRLLC